MYGLIQYQQGMNIFRKGNMQEIRNTVTYIRGSLCKREKIGCCILHCDRGFKNNIIYFKCVLGIFSPQFSVTIFLLVKVIFQDEIMNIILSCNLLKSSLILYLDLAATYQKLDEVHLYPKSLPYLGEFSPTSYTLIFRDRKLSKCLIV